MLALRKFSASCLGNILGKLAAQRERICGDWPQDAVISKNLKERLPNLPAIDEINKTPMARLV